MVVTSHPLAKAFAFLNNMEMEEKRGIMSSSNLLLRGTSCVGEPQVSKVKLEDID